MFDEDPITREALDEIGRIIVEGEAIIFAILLLTIYCLV